MANWVLKIDIQNEIKALNDFAENFSMSHVFEGDDETKYMNLVNDLQKKFMKYEDAINEVTDGDGTYENIMDELDDMYMASDLECSNYCMENVYQECDASGIWLIQF